MARMYDAAQPGLGSLGRAIIGVIILAARARLFVYSATIVPRPQSRTATATVIEPQLTVCEKLRDPSAAIPKLYHVVFPIPCKQLRTTILPYDSVCFMHP